MKAKIYWPLIALASAAASHASAATYLYQYTGHDLTDVTSVCCGPDTPFTTSDFIQFQFRSTGLLGPNEDDTGFAPPISSWSLSIGPLHYSSADPGSVLYSINFSTNAASQITEYQFFTFTDVVAPGLQPPQYPPQIYEEAVGSFDFPELNFGPEDAIYVPSIFMDSSYANNVGSPGTWTISAVPEPASWTMLLLGAAGIGGALRMTRRRRIPATEPC